MEEYEKEAARTIKEIEESRKAKAKRTGQKPVSEEELAELKRKVDEAEQRLTEHMRKVEDEDPEYAIDMLIKHETEKNSKWWIKLWRVFRIIFHT